MIRVLFVFVLFPLISWGALFSTDVKGTFLAAKIEKKPMILDFFGIWCPPCNELDETVFETTRFIEKAKSFQLLKIDADSDSSWKLKDKYKVGGYPTIIFTDSEGAEIYRLVGYRNLKEFLQVMDLVLSSKNKKLEQACASKNEDDLWRCAVICSERKNLECASEAYAKLQTILKPGTARFDWIRTYAMESVETPDLQREGYATLLRLYPNTPQALVWAVSYLAAFDDEKNLKPKKELVENLLKSFPQMLTDSRLDALGLSPINLVQIKAEILDKIGKREEAVAAWKEASILLEKEASQLPSGTNPRAFTLDRITCLEAAGDLEGALKLSNQYKALYPDEFTFYSFSAQILERMKKYSDAIPVAKKGYEVSYGDNKIRMATLLVRLYTAVSDKESAKKVVEEVTGKIKPDAKLEIRTHRYLKKLQEALKG
jgi:tetratricopeptide (TPR) repeat protein